MGIFDFVKNGVQRMMIARPDEAKEAVVYKHPDQTFPFWTQLTVDSDEVALFFKDGRFVGLLNAGRHTLDTQNIPFLGSLVDHFTGGNVFISELYFVTIRPIYNQTFGGPIGSMRDPELEIRVNPRAFGSYSFRVVDPSKFVVEFVGQTGAVDPDKAMQWVRDQLMMGVRSTLTALLRDGTMSMMDFGSAGPDVARSIVQNCPDLSRIGVSVLEIAKLNLNLSDEDQTRIDQFQDQIVQAKLDARKAKIAISKAESEAMAQHVRDQQVFANRAQYMNQFDMQRYRQFAAAEATMGMGEGMAKGDAGSAGMAGAGLAAGLGLGAGMQFGNSVAAAAAPVAGALYAGVPGAPYAGVPGAPYAGVPGAPYAGMPGAPYAGMPGAPYAGAPGAPYAAPPAAGTPYAAAPVGGVPYAAPPVAEAPAAGSCAKCGGVNPAAARFCSNCGQPLV